MSVPLLVVLLLLCLVERTRAVECSSDRDSLLSFYIATNGPKWDKRVNWKSQQDVCLWDGVECNDRSRVLSVQLEGFGITIDTSKGDMDSFACLTDLESLYLSYNRVKGGYPVVLCQLTKLKYLYMDGVGLTGSIPDCVCTGNQGMQYFSLVDNSVSGVVPWCMGSMPGLRSIDAAYNNLSGEVNPMLVESTLMETVSLKCNRKLSCDNIKNHKWGNPLLSFACGWSILCLLTAIKCC